MKYGMFLGQNAVDQFANDYNPGGGDGGGWAGILHGCVPDARDLALAFSKMGYDCQCRFSGWNVAGKQIPWVMSGQCTAEEFIRVHKDWQAIAKPGDRFVIGNSGHGYQYDTPMQFNGGTGMCFYNRMMRDSEFHQLLVGWPAGVEVIYVLDTCYSGGLREFFPMTPRVMPVVLKPEGEFQRDMPKSSDIQGSIVLLEAAQQNQTAADGQYNGAFTGSVLDVLDQMWKQGINPQVEWLFNGTKGLMATAFPKQTPNLTVLGNGASLLDGAL